MSTSITRFGRAALIAGFFLSSGITARAQDRTPFPALSDRPVYVAGVPDQYPKALGTNQAARGLVAAELITSLWLSRRVAVKIKPTQRLRG